MSGKIQLGAWCVLQAPRIFIAHFKLPELVLRLTFFNRFTQRIALVNTSLIFVGRLFGYIFHLIMLTILTGKNCFTQFITRMTASDLFHMFTQSIKFCTFYYHV